MTHLIWLRACEMRGVKARGCLLLILGLAACVNPRLSPTACAADWPQFGWDVSSSGSSPDDTGITTTSAVSLHRRQVLLEGTVDASAIYLHRVEVKGSLHDVFFVTTTYGKTIAIDADRGSVLWEYTPLKLASWEGSTQITNSTPAADPDRAHIYAAAPDGTIQKLAVADGGVLWSTPITQLPSREKIASPLREFHGHIIEILTDENDAAGFEPLREAR